MTSLARPTRSCRKKPRIGVGDRRDCHKPAISREKTEWMEKWMLAKCHYWQSNHTHFLFLAFIRKSPIIKRDEMGHDNWRWLSHDNGVITTSQVVTVVECLVYLRNRRWGGCVYVLQMFFPVFWSLFCFWFFLSVKKYQTTVLGNG